MEFVKNVGPIGMIFIMFSLGLNLTVKNFLEVVEKPRNLIIALICQMMILPLIGIIIISFFPMQAEFQLGVFLLLILPSAVMSNYATKLVKGNVALSITITSICALISFISIPIFLKIYSSFFENVSFDLNLLKFSVRMFLFIALPTFVGILVRGNFKKFSERNNLRFDRAAFFLFIFIIIIAIFTERDNLGGYFADVGAISFVVIVSILTSVYLITKFTLKEVKTQRTIMIEAMLQNGAMGLIVGAQLFHELEYMTPIAVYALIQYVALMFYIGNININRISKA
ncbi:bile acid:sodium symporter family protein [Candidatus Pelagibacter communis]|uniref:bile acid:sodium symporter family protein n=1 Tax=Pelagibacter ubique TaxID=198252 RepID=UPI00094D15EB|nr:hypothetical protein [Candidatus Pelagibacter ubique]